MRLQSVKIRKFKKNESGLNRFFGPLEAKIMDILWECDDQTIKEVQQVLEQEKATNFNTVMTVMNRLVDKGILQKRLEGRSYLYKPYLSRNESLYSQYREKTHVLMH